MLRRTVEIELGEWRQQRHRLPLIVRGARQVGKSYTVEKFGREKFETLAVVNFELEPAFKDCFRHLEPQKIVRELQVMTRCPIEAGRTLLFLDEIQACPAAIQALRYFKEKMPELAVVAAGSLLEFALREEDFAFPVGRVQFMYLKPLSFHEFLANLGEDHSLAFLAELQLTTAMNSGLHRLLLDLFKQYVLVGGMPAAVQAYVTSGSFLEVKRVHQLLLQTYQADFGKYATKAQHTHLRRFFEKAPDVVGRHFKYVDVDPTARSRDLKLALQQLGWAGLLTCVYATHASGLPLRAQLDERRFKLLFLDIGLLQTAGRMDLDSVFTKSVLQVRAGALAEQAVGQELLAYDDIYEIPQLFFWHRDKKNSAAEVDYVLQHKAQIVPIEVKAGSTGRLKSLRRFMEEKGAPRGVRIAENPVQLDGDILSIPFYAIEQLPRFIGTIS